jgi:hypothetical protein
LKYPVGTAFLIADTAKNSNRLFLVTARHVIENDSVTICLINFTTQNTPSPTIASVRKYEIKKSEWKYHPLDIQGKAQNIGYLGFDIAIAEIYIFRIQLNDHILWHKPIDLRRMTNIQYLLNNPVKIIAFPYVNKMNYERGLMLGDLEIENAVFHFSSQNQISFGKNRFVKDLNEVLISNPKFRPGYSGGLVFNSDKDIKIFGMAMGMSDIREIGSNKYCLAFFVKSDNILETLHFNFLK